MMAMLQWDLEQKMLLFRQRTKPKNSNEFSSAIYSIELLGDSTMISFQISDTLISVKAAKIISKNW